MMIRPLPIQTLAVLLATGLGLAAPALAQDVSGGATLGYSKLSIDGVGKSAAIGTLDAALDIDFGNGLSVGSTLSFQNMAVPDSDDFRTTTLALDARYRFDSGLTVGAYAETVRVDARSRSDVTSYGASLGYTTGLWGVEVYAGQTDLDGGLTADDRGVNLSITPNDRLTLGVSLARTEVAGFDYRQTRLAAVYGIGDRWSVFGGIDHTEGDLLTLRSWGVGLGYDLRLFDRPAILSVEYARARMEQPFRRDLDIEVIELGLTMPLGGRGAQVPLNSLAGKALRPRHSALAGVFDQGLGAAF